MKRRGRIAGRDRGMTLMEILISLSIVGMVMGGTVVGFRSLVKSELRGTAGRLAGAIRYSYDRAVSTGGFYRLHFNLDDQTYKLEHSSDRFLIQRDKERAGRGGKGLDLDKEAEREEEEQKRRYGTQQGLPPDLLPPPSPRGHFEEFKDVSVPTVKLKRVHILDIYTPRQDEPYTAGHAYLHFFPDGHTERAVIHLGTDPRDDDQYTLIVHGLTGKVEVRSGRIEASSELDTTDDAGNKKVDR